MEEAAKNFLSPRPSVNKSGAPNFFVQHDKVEDSKFCRYLETFGLALEQFLQRRTSSTTPLSKSGCKGRGFQGSCDLLHGNVHTKVYGELINFAASYSRFIAMIFYGLAGIKI